MKIAVITFPGSNCDEDALHVARNILGVDGARVWHREATLPAATDLVVLPGGFSYGDALRSGALARFSPIMDAVRVHADRGGLVLGICNGFQILLEAGLLPGAMLQNATRTFVCRPVALRVESTATPFTGAYSVGAELKIPVAHHEGRYHVDAETLRRMKGDDRVVLRYANDNPNGSLDDIAGIVNKARNVMGLMPHPERAAESVLGSRDGLGMFESAVRYVAEAGP